MGCLKGANTLGGPGLHCWTLLRSDMRLLRDLALLGVGSRRGVLSRLLGCSLWLALRLVVVTIMSPYAPGCGIGLRQRNWW